ncbi:MAG: hypothetical protein GY711_16870 [bacterium]|nr:hypothetical protein [bacterium]
MRPLKLTTPTPASAGRSVVSGRTSPMSSFVSGFPAAISAAWVVPGARLGGAWSCSV